MAKKPDNQAVCARCRRATNPADRFVVSTSDGSARAEFCRIEHVASWLLRGGRWPVGASSGEPTAAGPMELLRERDGTETRRSFADPDALKDWAVAGGLWGEAAAAG